MGAIFSSGSCDCENEEGQMENGSPQTTPNNDIQEQLPPFIVPSCRRNANMNTLQAYNFCVTERTALKETVKNLEARLNAKGSQGRV